MLFPYRTHYCTNSDRSLHLGDLVNIYQQCAANKYSTLYSSTVCPCCQNDAGDVLRFLCGLNPVVKYGRLYGEPRAILPWWFKEWAGEKSEYVKALNLPGRGKHVAVQIDGRSRGKKVPSWARKAIKLLKGAVNVGDRKLSCRNMTKATLAEKFEIISTARYYVGIDSGLTHLALMTDTPVVLIHPAEWDVKRFYPATDQIVSISSYKEFVNGCRNETADFLSPYQRAGR